MKVHEEVTLMNVESEERTALKKLAYGVLT